MVSSSPKSQNVKAGTAGVAQWRMVACALWLLLLGLGLGFFGERFSAAGSNLDPTEATRQAGTPGDLAQR
jgi:hypothetical protein